MAQLHAHIETLDHDFEGTHHAVTTKHFDAAQRLLASTGEEEQAVASFKSFVLGLVVDTTAGHGTLTVNGDHLIWIQTTEGGYESGDYTRVDVRWCTDDCED